MKQMTIEKLKTILVNRKKTFDNSKLYPSISIIDARVQGEIDCMGFIISLLEGDKCAIFYSEQYYMEGESL